MGICASQLPTWPSSTTSFAKLYDLDEKVVLAERPFAVTFKGKHRASGEPVAIKRFQRTLDISQQNEANGGAAADVYQRCAWEGEVAITKHLSARHPNVIDIKQVFETKREVLIVMEFVAGGELFDALISDGAYSEWDAKRLIQDTLAALQFLHERNVIHRDIKPENLLFTSRDSKTASIKVVNFALAKLAGQDTAVTSEQLTWPYCAPEILATIAGFSSLVESFRRRKSSMVDNQTSSIDGTPAPVSETQSPASYSVDIGVKCDIWSVGIVLYVLLSGTHPFDLDGRQTKDQIVQNVLLGKFVMSDESSIWSGISREAKDLLTLLLEVDPKKRPTAAQALEHEWFASPHTPRTPLSVSVSDGLGHYQRLMRKKFRTSVLVAMAAETFRRSLKKQREDTAAQCQSTSAPSPSSDPTSMVAGFSDVRDEQEPQENAAKYHENDEEAIRPVEISVEAGAGVSNISTQGSIMSRVFSKQTSGVEADEASAVDNQDICLEEKKEGVKQFSSRDI